MYKEASTIYEELIKAGFGQYRVNLARVLFNLGVVEVRLGVGSGFKWFVVGVGEAVEGVAVWSPEARGVFASELYGVYRGVGWWFGGLRGFGLWEALRGIGIAARALVGLGGDPERVEEVWRIWDLLARPGLDREEAGLLRSRVAALEALLVGVVREGGGRVWRWLAESDWPVVAAGIIDGLVGGDWVYYGQFLDWSGERWVLRGLLLYPGGRVEFVEEVVPRGWPGPVYYGLLAGLLAGMGVGREDFEYYSGVVLPGRHGEALARELEAGRVVLAGFEPLLGPVLAGGLLAGGRYVWEYDGGLSVVPGLVGLAVMSSGGGGGGSVVVVGDPSSLKPLPGAREEARYVAGLLEGVVGGVRLLLGGEATRGALLGASPIRLLHYAGHSVFNPADPYESALLLSDGVVYARDIVLGRLSFSGGMVYLSSCEVGYTGGSEGEWMGFIPDLLARGARAVVASMRPIPDVEARLFAEEYYRGLVGGLDSLRAYNRALARMARGGPPSTYYMVHFGVPYRLGGGDGGG